MPRKRLAWLFMVVGALLAIPAALVIVAFVGGLADADALAAAPICATPTQDGISNCLSEFDGTITAVTPHSKSLDHVTLAVGGASYDLGYDCHESPAKACDAVSFKPGTPVVAGWWRGQLVAFGAAETRPTIVTELHPFDNLGPKLVLLDFIVVPAVSSLLGGFLLLQAPSTVDELVAGALARWPDPPRLIDRRQIWMVSLAYWAPFGYLAWFLLDMLVTFVLLGSTQYRLALLIQPATFVVSFGAAAVIAARYLTRVVRTSTRRSLTISKIKTGLGKTGKDTQVWYDLLNGKAATTTLNVYWNGMVKEGDRLDALTDPKDGSIVRLLSTPHAQA